MAVLPFLVAFAAAFAWAQQKPWINASSSALITVQAEVSSKTTIHVPHATTTNGHTTHRMRQDYIVVVSIPVPGKPALHKSPQYVSAGLYKILFAGDPVSVTLNPSNLHVTEVTPGVIPDYTRGLALIAFAMLILGAGAVTVVWRRTLQDVPDTVAAE